MTTIQKDFTVQMRALMMAFQVWGKSYDGGHFRAPKRQNTGGVRHYSIPKVEEHQGKEVEMGLEFELSSTLTRGSILALC